MEPRPRFELGTLACLMDYQGNALGCKGIYQAEPPGRVVGGPGSHHLYELLVPCLAEPVALGKVSAGLSLDPNISGWKDLQKLWEMSVGRDFELALLGFSENRRGLLNLENA